MDGHDQWHHISRRKCCEEQKEPRLYHDRTEQYRKLSPSGAALFKLFIWFSSEVLVP